PGARPYVHDWTVPPVNCPAPPGQPSEDARALGGNADRIVSFAPSRADIRFEEREQPGVEQRYTYHVDRAEFDHALLKHAHTAGAAVFEGVDVTGASFPEGEDPIVHFRAGSREHDARVRLVVDASGRRTLVGSQLKLKVKDPLFDQYALHTWFED